jgi:hypothetical protein
MAAMNMVSAGGFSGVSFHLRTSPQGVASVLCKKTLIFGSRRSNLDHLTVHRETKLEIWNKSQFLFQKLMLPQSTYTRILWSSNARYVSIVFGFSWTMDANTIIRTYFIDLWRGFVVSYKTLTRCLRKCRRRLVVWNQRPTQSPRRSLWFNSMSWYDNPEPQLQMLVRLDDMTFTPTTYCWWRITECIRVKHRYFDASNVTLPRSGQHKSKRKRSSKLSQNTQNINIDELRFHSPRTCTRCRETKICPGRQEQYCEVLTFMLQVTTKQVLSVFNTDRLVNRELFSCFE